MNAAFRSLALALVAPACVSVRAVEAGDPVDLADGEAFAFGRLRVLEQGRELTPWNADLLEELFAPGEPEVRLALFRVESEQRALYPAVDEDGWFAWILPQGTWLLYRSAQEPPIWHDVLCAFQVRAGPEAQYVGELELEIEVERDADLQALAYSVTWVSARADADAARAHLARRNPGAALAVVERPLVSSPELRGLFDDWKRSHAERVLAELGLALLEE